MPRPVRYPASRYQPPPLVDLGSRDVARAAEPGGAQGVLQHHGALEAARRGRAGAARRRHERPVLRDEAQPGPHARRRPADAHLLPDRHLQGARRAATPTRSPTSGSSGPNTNPLFAGATPLAYMIRGGLPAMQTRAPAARRAARRLMMDARSAASRSSASSTRTASSRRGTCRGGDSVLTRIADDDEHLQAIFELDAATNDRLLAEHQRFPGIGVEELVFGVPCSHVVNAAFCHPHPLGARFNGPERGAWYAAFALETSQAEVAFHKAVELAETAWTEEESITYDDYLADFSARLPRSAPRARASRRASIRRATSRRRRWPSACSTAGSLGVVYPSVRQRRRHVPRVLPSGAGHQRAARRHVPLHVSRRRVPCDRARAVAHAAGVVRRARASSRPTTAGRRTGSASRGRTRAACPRRRVRRTGRSSRPRTARAAPARSRRRRARRRTAAAKARSAECPACGTGG